MTESTQSLQIQKLFTLAAKDEGSLALPLHDALYGFVAQQSCEKLMKALITACGQKYPLTHDLNLLRKLLTKSGEELPELPFPLEELIPFAVEFRYDEGEPLSVEELAAIRQTVSAVRVFVYRRVRELGISIAMDVR